MSLADRVFKVTEENYVPKAMTSPLLTAKQTHIWDSDLPTYFDEGTFPELELETYGLQVAHAQLVKVVKWLEEPCKEHYGCVQTPDGRIIARYTGPYRHMCEKCMESLKELVK